MKAIARGLPEKAALAALTTNPAKLCGIENSVGTLEKGKVANLLIAEGRPFSGKMQNFIPLGFAGLLTFCVRKTSPRIPTSPTQANPMRDRLPNSRGRNESPLKTLRPCSSKDSNFGRSEDEGILTGQDLLIQNGKILSIGKNLEGQLPEDSKIIEGKGKHLTPGIIDCHSHAMILGGVNESTLPSTAMVRIADVVNSESINLEWQLAGGVTACNLLHGSANPIGGQMRL